MNLLMLSIDQSETQVRHNQAVKVKLSIFLPLRLYLRKEK